MASPAAAAAIFLGYSILLVVIRTWACNRRGWPNFVVDLKGNLPRVDMKQLRTRTDITVKMAYWASPFEQEWASSPQAGKQCATAIRQASDAELWLNYSTAAFHPQGHAARAPTSKEAEVLSYFVDRNGQKRYIEPLSGVARHPLALKAVGCLNKTASSTTTATDIRIFDIRYLITDNYCDGQRPKPQVKFFDLGCTVFAGGKDGKTNLTSYTKESGSGSGPSIPLFYGMFRDRCLEPDDIFAWEAKQMSGAGWWSQVPVDIRGKLRFYNAPVQELSLKQSIAGEVAPDASFLRMLPLVAKQEDYVILKVDIDLGPELQIVEAIAAQPELSALVDELFFEYHFNFEGATLNKRWGKSVIRTSSVDTAIGLMTRLRQAGIRSHFWI